MEKAIRLYKTGGPEVLQYEDVVAGEPGPGEVRVRHAAIGLNFADTYFRSGLYPAPMPNGGRIRIEINQRYELRDAIRAHEDIEQRRTVGSSIFLT